MLTVSILTINSELNTWQQGYAICTAVQTTQNVARDPNAVTLHEITLKSNMLQSKTFYEENCIYRHNPHILWAQLKALISMAFCQ